MASDHSPGVPTARDQQILALLHARDGVLTRVRLQDGSVLDVWDIAWSYDSGDRWAHVTTNISPGPEGSTYDFVSTREVTELLDPHTAIPLVSLSPGTVSEN